MNPWSFFDGINCPAHQECCLGTPKDSPKNNTENLYLIKNEYGFPYFPIIHRATCKFKFLVSTMFLVT